jgi:threonine dehydrogenase-like Zn-dependent dehydrogenase
VQRLMLEGRARVFWEEVEGPASPPPGAALVQPMAVATCDLDVGVLRGRFPLPGPYPFGHEGVVEVVEIGEDVTSVLPGDRAVVPFQISCGTCGPCRRGRTGNCSSHPRLSTYGLGGMGGLEWGGFLADVIAVPHADAMLVKIPPGMDPLAIASASDNIPDGWRTVGPQLTADPGTEVLVFGGDAGPNSIGLYATGLAVWLGSERVVYLDQDPDRLAIAAVLGAEVMEGAPPKKAGSFPITVDASGAPAGLRCALNSTAFDGTCTSPSVYFEDRPYRCSRCTRGAARCTPAGPTCGQPSR